MPRQLIATKPTGDARRKRTLIELRDGDTLVLRTTVNPDNAAEIRREFTKPHGIDVASVQQACDIPEGETTKRVELTSEKQPDTTPVHVTVRSKTSSEIHKTASIQPDEFAAVATDADAPPDALITWESTSRLCCLDIDTPDALDRHQAYAVASNCQPRPRWWHQSQGGGLHLYYTDRHGFAASELAAVAALWVRHRNSSYSCELKHDTRHPVQSGHPWHEETPTIDLGPVAAWLRGETTIDAASWLADNGFAQGERYPHTRCLIDPRPTTGDTPVHPLDDGIYCQVCAGQGRTLGSRKPGFVPYSYLTGGAVSVRVRRLVEHCVHWEQARVVLANLVGVEGAIAEQAYVALLKMFHGPDDVRTSRVTSAGQCLIRRAGYWDFDGAPLKISMGRNILATLPAVQNPQGKPIPSLVDVACQQAGQRTIGYDDIDVVRGMRIYGHHLSYPPDRIVTVRWDGEPGFQPRYIEPKLRGDVNAAWDVVTQFFPGVHVQYLKLLIVARGFAEAAMGMPPIIYTTGVTGSGKSQTVHLAASICGDVNTETPWSADNQRFRQGIQLAASSGGFCTINEIGKGAQRVRMPMDQALESVLTLTPDSTSHQLYTGPVKLGRAPAIVFTETDAVEELKSSAQLGRRMMYLKLHEEVKWDASITPQAFRTHNDVTRDACDVILSDIIDQYFAAPSTFHDAASMLGVATMRDHYQIEESKRDTYVAFFDAWCDAKPLDGKSLTRIDPKRKQPWRVVSRSEAESDANRLSQLYLDVVGEREFEVGTKLKELTWKNQLAAKGDTPIECEIKPYPGAIQKVAVLFRRKVTRGIWTGYVYDKESMLSGC